MIFPRKIFSHILRLGPNIRRAIYSSASAIRMHVCAERRSAFTGYRKVNLRDDVLEELEGAEDGLDNGRLMVAMNRRFSILSTARGRIDRRAFRYELLRWGKSFFEFKSSLCALS